jgi:hypothetical protein
MRELSQSEWDTKAFEIFQSLKEKDPTLEELHTRILSRIGPRPGTMKTEDLSGTIAILEKLNTRKGWHRLKCTQETMLRIWALDYAQIELRPSGWYDMKLTRNGRQFLRDVAAKRENSKEKL